MKTIYKYPLEVTDVQKIILPIGAEILTIQTQNEKPCIWALVDTEQLGENRTIEIFGTGHPMPEGMGIERWYLGTFQLRGGELVFHAFEYTGL